MNQLDCATLAIFMFAGLGILAALVAIVAAARDGYGRVAERKPSDRESRWG
ncbi:hypothetical protein [Frondihabitans sp. Leaf304]|uniref:hypothetical protein n=1 Tax=Frondihabitans sp. Leaf304 TaxID=1736329 RepID=UPI0012F9D28E|nr:hypothetical protein [Frondihabitans sp. Leaf304]